MAATASTHELRDVMFDPCESQEMLDECRLARCRFHAGTSRARRRFIACRASWLFRMGQRRNITSPHESSMGVAGMQLLPVFRPPCCSKRPDASQGPGSSFNRW